VIIIINLPIFTQIQKIKTWEKETKNQKKERLLSDRMVKAEGEENR
jgi:hypothetical protein